MTPSRETAKNYHCVQSMDYFRVSGCPLGLDCPGNGDCDSCYIKAEQARGAVSEYQRQMSAAKRWQEQRDSWAMGTQA